MKNNHFFRISIPKVLVALVLITSLGILGCSNTLASKPAASGLSIQVNGAGAGAGARGITSDPQVTAGSVVVMAYDSTTSAYLGTTGKMVKGADFYSGNLVPSANGTLWFRAFVKDSTGNFLYYGEGTQIVTDVTATISITIIVETTNTKTNRAAIDLDTDQGLGAVVGSAGRYVILAKSAIDGAGDPSKVHITGDIGLSPAAATFITGFSLTGATGYATSSLLMGVPGTYKAYAADQGGTTATNLTKAVENMLTAYTAAAGRPSADYTNLGTGEIGGLTLIPGLYKWTTGITAINGNVTLDGGPTDVWIFQVASDITFAKGISVTLAGGALAKNIFWQTSGVANFGMNAHLEGVVLSGTAITLGTGATANGRLLAQTQVTLNGNAVVQPAP